MSIKDIVTGDIPEDKPKDILADLPMKFEPRCRVCKSEFRPIIDRLLVAGNTYVGIAAQFQGKDQYFVGSVDAIRKSIERHRKAHLSVSDASIRDILEAKAREAGVLVETATRRMIHEEALLELAVAKGTEQLSNPDSKIKYQDAIKAAELLRDKKYEEMGIQLDIVNRQFNSIVQAIQKIVPKELYPEIVATAQAIFEGRPLHAEREELISIESGEQELVGV